MQPFATVSDQLTFLRALRKRSDQLGWTHEGVEDFAGLQSGYLSKILGEPPMKRATPYTLFLAMQALGLEAQLIELPQVVEKYEKRYGRRKIAKQIRAAARTPKTNNNPARPHATHRPLGR